MAEGKKGFILYSDHRELFDSLCDKDCAELIRHIFKYVNDENPVTENQIVNVGFISIRQQLKRDLKKWENIKERNKTNGSQGGRPKNGEPKETQRNPKKPKEPVIVNDIVNVNDIEDKKEGIPFEIFWNVYNKKVGSKERCSLKWFKLKEKERQTIMDTLPKFLSLITDKQYQPHPETYLNGKRWNDELIDIIPKDLKTYSYREIQDMSSRTNPVSLNYKLINMNGKKRYAHVNDIETFKLELWKKIKS